MTSNEADQTLARFNHYLAILSPIDAKRERGEPLTQDEADTAREVEKRAHEALVSLQAWVDAKAIIARAQTTRRPLL